MKIQKAQQILQLSHYHKGYLKARVSILQQLQLPKHQNDTTAPLRKVKGVFTWQVSSMNRENFIISPKMAVC